MSEMVDRLADAIGKCANEPLAREGRLILEKVGGHPERFIQERLARAMLAALRDALDDFLLAAGEPYRGQIDRAQSVQMRREALNRMIDEALR